MSIRVLVRSCIHVTLGSVWLPVCVPILGEVGGKLDTASFIHFLIDYLPPCSHFARYERGCLAKEFVNDDDERQCRLL